MNSKGRQEKKKFILEKSYVSEYTTKCWHLAAVDLIDAMNLDRCNRHNNSRFIMGYHRSSAVGKIKSEFMRGLGRCDLSDFKEFWPKWRIRKGTLEESLGGVFPPTPLTPHPPPPSWFWEQNSQISIKNRNISWLQNTNNLVSLSLKEEWSFVIGTFVRKQ